MSRCCVERLEQPAQLFHVRQLGESHQVGFAGDHIFHAARSTPARSTTCCARRIASSISWFRFSRVSLQLARAGARAPALSVLAAELLVQIIGRAPQLVRAVIALELQDAVLHLAIVARPGSPARGCRTAARTRSGSTPRGSGAATSPRRRAASRSTASAKRPRPAPSDRREMLAEAAAESQRSSSWSSG